MPSKVVEIEGVGVVEFPDSMDDAAIAQAIEADILPNARPVASRARENAKRMATTPLPSTTTKAEAERKRRHESFPKGTPDIVKSAIVKGSELDPVSIIRGQVKGGIGTLYHLGKLVGLVPENKDFEAALESETSGEAVGKFTEQAAEFMGGEAVVKAGVKAVPMLARAAQAAPRTAAVVEGVAVGGAVSAAQGGDAKTGAVIGGAVPAAGAAISAVVPALTKRLLASAQQSYARVLGATKQNMKNVANRVIEGYDSAGTPVEGLIQRGVRAWTRRGLDRKAAEEVVNLGDQIDNLWSSLPADETIAAKPILDAIESARSQLIKTGPVKTIAPAATKQTGAGFLAQTTTTPAVTAAQTTILEPAAVKNLNRMTRIIESLTDDAGQVNVHQLREVRQVLDEVVAGKGGYAGAQLSIADHAGVLARRKAANSIRNELAQAFPDIAKINRQFHFWSDVSNVLQETLRRTSSQSQPMGEQLMRVAGAAAAPGRSAVRALFTGEVFKLIREVTTSSAWGTTSAVLKDRLAKALASGSKGATIQVLKSIAQAQQSASTRKAEKKKGAEGE